MTDSRDPQIPPQETPEPQCEVCGGSGQRIIGEHYVSRDMAIDAGDRSMEGSFHSYEYGPCDVCDGAGAQPELTFMREAMDAAVKDREYFIAHAKRLEAFVCDAVCEECGHLFTAADIIAEQPEAWGHPCHGKTTKPVSACESYRAPIAPGSSLSEGLTRELLNALKLAEWAWHGPPTHQSCTGCGRWRDDGHASGCLVAAAIAKAEAELAAPKAEGLKTLIAKWREESENVDAADGMAWKARCHTYKNCADELAALLADAERDITSGKP